MNQAIQPPGAPFCMQCGPGTVLQADQPAQRLRCPRCGAQQRLPAYPLFVVTGASGTGKSTIVEPLRHRLSTCEVLETDLILQVAALGWDTWRTTWLQLAHAIALNGRATVLCGSLLPEHLQALPARRLIGPVHFCTLDCPDAVLAERLRTRPAWRAWTEERIVEHQRFAAGLRARIQPTFDTGVLSVEEVADRIASWIRPLLADVKRDEIPFGGTWPSEPAPP